jgi:hypothetical protein
VRGSERFIMNHFFKKGFFNEISNTLYVNAICQ